VTATRARSSAARPALLQACQRLRIRIIPASSSLSWTDQFQRAGRVGSTVQGRHPARRRGWVAGPLGQLRQQQQLADVLPPETMSADDVGGHQTRSYEVRLPIEAETVKVFGVASSPASVTVPRDHPERRRRPGRPNPHLGQSVFFNLAGELAERGRISRSTSVLTGADGLFTWFPARPSTTLYLTPGKDVPTIQVAAYKDYLDSSNWGYRS